MKSTLFALLFSSAALAQGQRDVSEVVHDKIVFEFEGECGSPLVESMGWAGLNGTVARVVDGRSFLLETEQGKNVQVALVAVDIDHADEKAREALLSWIQDRSVSVLVNPRSSDAERVIGVVHAASLDVNRELLRTGVARYKKPLPYSVSDYVACTYRIAEREAKQEKRGLWQ